MEHFLNASFHIQKNVSLIQPDYGGFKPKRSVLLLIINYYLQLIVKGYSISHWK